MKSKSKNSSKSSSVEKDYKPKNNDKEYIEDNEPISLTEFLKLPLTDIVITSSNYISNKFSSNFYSSNLYIYSPSKYSYEISSQKKFGEFQDLYNNLTTKFKKIKLPEIPSKFNIQTASDIRIKIDNLLKNILNVAKMNPQNSNFLMKELYKFCISSCKNKEIKTPISDEILNQYFNNNDLNKENKKDEKEVLNFSDDKTDETNNEYSFESNNVYITINKDISFKGYINIKDNVLFFYKSKNISNNNYVMILPLYKILYEIHLIDINTKKQSYIEFNQLIEIFKIENQKNNLKDCNMEILISLYHPFDTSLLTIKFNEFARISQIKNFFRILDECNLFEKNISNYINPINVNNVNIYGKIIIDLLNVNIEGFNGFLQAKIILPPYNFESKKISGSEEFTINQSFSLPIHNRFDTIKFEIYTPKKESIFSSSSNEKIYEGEIEITEVLNNYYYSNEDIELELTIACKNKDIRPLLKNEIGILNLKITDYSSLLVLIEKNKNKKILEDMDLENDDLGIKSLFKRLLKAIDTCKEIHNKYLIIFNFKYPIFSFFMMIVMFIYFITFNSIYIVRHLIFVVIILMTLYSKFYSLYCSEYINKYLFSIRNKYDFESEYIITKKEIKNSDYKKPKYLIESEEKNILSSIVDPIKNFNEYKKKYYNALLTFTEFVGSFEKIKNLFLWTDPLMSLYFYIILVIAYFGLFKIDIKYMFLFSFGKKFFFGYFYFKWKNINNLEIGRIVLEDCIKNWREKTEETLKNKNIETVNSIDIYSIKIFDDKFKNMIKEKLEKSCKIKIKETFFDNIKTIGDIINELGRCKEILKITKISNLYHFTLKNDKIFKKDIDIEDYFYYFIQNIKSDYYIVRHELLSDTKEENDMNVETSKISQQKTI